MSSVEILAPAKINLGLAILAKRPDGYHEIDTIMAMIDLRDKITIRATTTGEISISGMDDVPTPSNLMTKAASAWVEAAGVKSGWHIDIVKRIPSPGGIGGGSSDAAAVLRALNHLHNRPLTESQLHVLASKVGSDCPFFLGEPCSRATGIGTNLRAIPVPNGCVVLAISRISALAKTATLYGALGPRDFGSIEQIGEIEARIANQRAVSTELPNSFERVAFSAFPELAEVRRTMIEVTGEAHLSGAGPAMYAVANTESQAITWAEELGRNLPEEVEILTAHFLHARPIPEILT